MRQKMRCQQNKLIRIGGTRIRLLIKELVENFFVLIFGRCDVYNYVVELALLIIVLIALVVLIAVTVNKKPSLEIVEWLKSTSNRIENQNNSFNERLDNATRVISQVQKNIC